MSAPGSQPVPYRQIAERTLGQAAGELNSIPVGQVNASEAQFHVAKAQAIATVAVAQALLELGDVLRTLTDRPGNGDDQ